MEALAKDFTIVLKDQPGTLAKATDAIAKAGVNIDGFCGFPVGNEGQFHVLIVKDAQKARRAVEEAGFTVKNERDVVVVDGEDRPGFAAEIFKRIASEELNVDLTYLATDTRIVIGGPDVTRIQKVVSETPTAVRR
ncbi:MAG TPA: hypothetical protein VMJ92_01915 [Candidatus Limnocylindrales bacterium]|nr:hypothetical protein [Candidatus Limnocylindrales bacterium]